MLLVILSVIFFSQEAESEVEFKGGGEGNIRY